MIPIQSDPARRIRRIQGHVQRYQERLAAWESRNGKSRPRSDGHVDKLYCAEMVFAVEYAAAAEQTIAEQKARIEELERANDRLRSDLDFHRNGLHSRYEP